MCKSDFEYARATRDLRHGQQPGGPAFIHNNEPTSLFGRRDLSWSKAAKEEAWIARTQYEGVFLSMQSGRATALGFTLGEWTSLVSLIHAVVCR